MSEKNPSEREKDQALEDMAKLAQHAEIYVKLPDLLPRLATTVPMHVWVMGENTLGNRLVLIPPVLTWAQAWLTKEWTEDAYSLLRMCQEMVNEHHLEEKDGGLVQHVDAELFAEIKTLVAKIHGDAIKVLNEVQAEANRKEGTS